MRHAEGLHYRHTRKHRKDDRDPWYSWLPVGLSIVCFSVVVDVVLSVSAH